MLQSYIKSLQFITFTIKGGGGGCDVCYTLHPTMSPNEQLQLPIKSVSLQALIVFRIKFILVIPVLNQPNRFVRVKDVITREKSPHYFHTNAIPHLYIDIDD